MKNLKILLLAALVLSVASAAFAQKPQAPAKAEPAAPKKETPAPVNGLLYRISGKSLTKPSFLFGTIHIICPNDLFGMEQLAGYFNQTERLYLELDMDDAAVMSRMMTALNMPEGKKLQDLLTPEKYARVDEMFKNTLGVSVGVLSQFNPVGLSVILSASPKSTGCAAPASYESKFVELAAAGKKTVDGLETVEEQIAALNKNPLEKQAEDLYKMTLDPQKTVDQFKQMLAVYKLQDSEKLAELVVAQSTDDPQFAARLLDERNQNWIPKIESVIAEKPTFIAVGGGHLGGKKGVVNLLRQKGYTVEAIKF